MSAHSLKPFSRTLSISSGERPTLPTLLRLRVPQRVGANYSTFGILLLNDKTGSRVDAIDDECRGKPERIVLGILQEWLEGKGLPLTWESLVQTLRDTGLSFHAGEIAAKVSQSSSSMYVQYCSCQIVCACYKLNLNVM